MLSRIRFLTVGIIFLGIASPTVHPQGESEGSSLINAGVDAVAPRSAAVATYDETPGDKGDELRKDVLLVLDNSGSMKKNDPDFLTSRAVTEFIEELDEATRVAIIIFDEEVRFTVPFTQVLPDSKKEILESLRDIDYRGRYTDSSGAIERAIYELKNNGRDSVSKLIVFMTDGIVDTGNRDTDLKNESWLKQSLAPDAADAGIRIFAIAFTEAADFQLIQSLAQTTQGEYFRALKAEDLYAVFEKINEIISQAPEPELAGEDVIAVQEGREVTTVQEVNQKAQFRDMMFFVIALVLAITLVAILVLLLRRGRETVAVKQEYTAEAYLKDIHGYTSRLSYKLGNRPTMLGRVAGKNTRQLDYIVIPETTIGRRHALIEFKDFAYWIVDQGTINGTFVNDRLINSEVRLKHSDKIKLHKFEFDFVMPEMLDAGMTVVSKTLFTSQSPAVTGGTGGEPSSDSIEDELGIGFDHENGSVEMTGPMEDDQEMTLVRGEADTSEQVPNIEPEAETQTHGRRMSRSDNPSSTHEAPGEDDETLMPGGFGMADDEATIRKEGPSDANSIENIINLNEIEDNSENKN